MRPWIMLPLLRTSLMYLIALLVFRLMGKLPWRMAPFDLAVMIMIGDVAGSIQTLTRMWHVIIPIFT